jgi:hypothetical protein
MSISGRRRLKLQSFHNQPSFRQAFSTFPWTNYSASSSAANARVKALLVFYKETHHPQGLLQSFSSPTVSLWCQNNPSVGEVSQVTVALLIQKFLRLLFEDRRKNLLLWASIPSLVLGRHCECQNQNFCSTKHHVHEVENPLCFSPWQKCPSSLGCRHNYCGENL